MAGEALLEEITRSLYSLGLQQSDVESTSRCREVRAQARSSS